jgi:lipopolysaccharide biosynthesis protein
MNKKARVIAFYLPQFHPIPENDKWWGKGFTEWTNVRKAIPLFKGHYQPRVPADLGYYDLRIPEVREQQAQMAKEAGIEGFCYWHYWFGNGKQLLERPFQEVLETEKPNFPFCLGWANHSWTNKTWEVGKKFVKEGTLIEQTYSVEDYVKHFYAILPALKDKRYIKVDNKPLFVVYAPYDIPNARYLINKWNDLAKQNGIEGIHFAGLRDSFRIKSVIKGKKSWNNIFHFNNVSYFFNDVLEMGFDAVISTGHQRAQAKSTNLLLYAARRFFLRKMNIYNVKKYQYRKIIKNYYTKEDAMENVYPTIIPNRDRTPRSGKAADIWHGSTPDLFKKHVVNALEVIKNKKEEHKILFLQSWNEWGEGNYIEPDIVFGRKYLECLKQALCE